MRWTMLIYKTGRYRAHVAGLSLVDKIHLLCSVRSTIYRFAGRKDCHGFMIDVGKTSPEDNVLIQALFEDAMFKTKTRLMIFDRSFREDSWFDAVFTGDGSNVKVNTYVDEPEVLNEGGAND